MHLPYVLVLAVSFALLSTPFVFAQPAFAPFTTIPYAALRVHDTSVPPAEEARLERSADAPADTRISRKIVGYPSGAWVIVQFGSFNLGSNSLLIITSTRDTDQIQLFTHDKLLAWGRESAAFNGTELQIDLLASPYDGNVFYDITAFVLGEHVSAPTGTPPTPPDPDHLQTADQPLRASPCGTDDRRPSSDIRVGRLMPRLCTAWPVRGGLFLTAGHCIDSSNTRKLQFRVPLSLPNGTIHNPLVKHQFPISSIHARHTGEGNDWAIFAVHPDDLNRLPHQIYGSIKIARHVPDNAALTIPSYGYDDDPPGIGGGANRHSNTLQEAVGQLRDYDTNAALIRHDVDTTTHSSGAPILLPDGRTAIGIHTHGTHDADCSGSPNSGTGFLNDRLWNTIRKLSSTTP